MIIAKAEIIITNQTGAVFPYGTEITIEVKGDGIKEHLNEFSLQLWRAGLTPIQWTIIEKLTKEDINE